MKEGIKWMEDGIKVSNLPADAPALGSYYANIGIIYSDNNQHLQGIEYMDKAIQLYASNPEKYKHTLGILYQNKAIYLEKAGLYEEAKKAIYQMRKYLNDFHTQLAEASIYSYAGKPDSSLICAQKAMTEIFIDFDEMDFLQNPNKFNNTKSDYWAGLALTLKGSALFSIGKRKKDADFLERGLECFELSNSFYDRLYVKMNGYETTKMSYNQWVNKNLSRIIASYDELNNLSGTGKYLGSLYEAIEKQKAMLLLQTLTPKVLPKAVLAEEETLVNQKNALEQKLLFTDSTAYYQNELFRANEELEAFLQKIRQEYPPSSMTFDHIEYPSIENIQQKLDEQSILLEYAIYTQGRKLDKTNYLYVWYITKNSCNYLMVTLDESFFPAIEQVTSLLKNPFLVQKPNQDKLIDASHQLYQILLQPIEKELVGKSKLVIIPDGELFYLPFELLLASNEKKNFNELDFLVNQYDICYQYSANIYLQTQQKKSIGDQSLLAFAPVFDNHQNVIIANRSIDMLVDSLYRSIEGGRFVGLPNSEIEVKNIEASIKEKGGNTTLLLKEKATKVQLLEQLQKPYQFIHFATHGLVNFKEPKLSALACYDRSDQEDNLLIFANEIQGQNIQADLVVLSSCESGIGQLIEGEGLIALNRSFIYAGAKNVLFSLWKVNDQYTSDLMIDFYKNYLSTNDYSQALRQAKLKMLENPTTANPSFWAPFVLIGE